MKQQRAGFFRGMVFAVLCAAGPVLADPIPVDIPAQPLDSALTTLGRQAGLTVVTDPALVRGKTAPAVSGTMEPAAALEALLKGSGLVGGIQSGTVTLRKAPPGNDAESLLPEVSVTGAAETAAMPGELPAPYAGGQVARGAQVGMLGNRDYMDTPFSITSYTAQTAQDQQARTLADVLMNDPSVRGFYSQSFPQDAFIIRGFQVDDIASDGLYGNSAMLRTSPQLVERVEVLKGPSALLNGAQPFGGVGGAVNLVPKRAGDQPITQVTGSFASDTQFGAHVDVGRRFGPDNSVGLRFNGLFRDGDMALDDNSQQLGAGVLALDFRGESVRLFLDLGVNRQREEGIENSFSPAGTATAVPDAPDAAKRIFQPWTYLKSDDTFGTVRGEFDLNENLTVFAAFGTRRNELEEVYPFGFDLANSGDFLEFLTPHQGYNETRTTLVGARGKFGAGTVRHDVVFNASTFNQERGNYFGGFVPPPGVPSNIYAPNFIESPPVAFGDVVKDSDLDMAGLALSDTMTLGERWTVVLGARLQSIKLDDIGRGTSSDDEKVSPALGVIFKSSEQISLYANYIEGLSPGSGFAANANIVLPPSVTKQLEAGVKADFGNAGALFSVFHIEKPNEIQLSTGQWSQDGMQRNQGIELTVFGEPARGLRWLGGVMLLDGEQVKTANGEFDGKGAQNAPEVSVNFGGEWDATFAPGLTFTGRMIYTSEQFVDQGNLLTIPDWWRLDMGARYAMKAGGRPLTLRAGIENVTDEAYWANSFLYRGAPRTFLVSATVDF